MGDARFTVADCGPVSAKVLVSTPPVESSETQVNCVDPSVTVADVYTPCGTLSVASGAESPLR